LETRGIIARRDPASGMLQVWIASQNPYRIRDGISHCLGIPPGEIRVMAGDVGGGFGCKGMIYPEEIVCCLLALHLGRPIKWVETRIESFLSTNHAREMLVEAAIAARRNGTILGIDVKLFQDCGAYCHYELVLPTAVINHLPNQYRIPNLRAEGHAVLTNKVQVSPYRGAGRPEAVFVIERLIEMLARRIGVDPADVRRANLVRPEELPYSSGLRMWNGWPIVYDSGDFPGMFERALELADYSRWRKEQRQAREEGRLLGVGIAACIEGGGIGPSEGATVSVEETGRVDVILGVGSQGQSHETVFAQVCADVLGVEFEDVSVRGGDTNLFPEGFGTRASRVAVNAGNAVAKAAEVLKTKVSLIAAELLECSRGDIVIESGRAGVRGVPGRTVSMAEIARAATGAVGPADARPVLAATEFFHPDTATWAGSVHVAVAEVDADTGTWRVLKYVVVHDCGRALNVQVVEGQVVGGIAQGLGMILGEELVYDEFGQLVTGSLMDYAVPRADDMPDVVLEHMDFPARSNALGVKGIGEGSVAGPPAAIANAIEDAIGGGARVTRTPLTSQRVWELLGKLAQRRRDAT
jgi:carbon-monoxide dehydrogenase large subunit